LDSPDGTKPRYTQLRKGRWYWEPPLRLRRSHGLVVQALGADQAAAWAYARKLNRDLAGLDPDQAAPGTVTWLFERFFASDRFAGLALSTQKDYRWLARRLGEVSLGSVPLGRVNALSVRPRHADRIYQLLKETSGHATAHYACRFARRVWKWAGRRELVAAHPNPWAGMELAGLTQRHQRWTAEQVLAVVEASVEMGRASVGLAVLLAYWLGHRQGDVLALTWTALEDGHRHTNKTGVRVPIVAAAYPELAAALAAERARQEGANLASTHVVVCEMTGRPWLPDTFRHEFRRVAVAAGLPGDLQFRDLRATATTELADAGADVVALSTHTGHLTVEMARRYTRRTADGFQRAAAQRLAARKNRTGGGEG
jgi:integrase